MGRDYNNEERHWNGPNFAKKLVFFGQKDDDGDRK